MEPGAMKTQRKEPEGTGLDIAGRLGVQDYINGKWIVLVDADGWPVESVKRAAMAMSKRAGDGINHPYYADLFVAGFAAYIDALDLAELEDKG